MSADITITGAYNFNSGSVDAVANSDAGRVALGDMCGGGIPTASVNGLRKSDVARFEAALIARGLSVEMK